MVRVFTQQGRNRLSRIISLKFVLSPVALSRTGRHHLDGLAGSACYRDVCICLLPLQRIACIAPHTVEQQSSRGAVGNIEEPATQLRRTGRSRNAAAVAQTPAGNGVGTSISGEHGRGHAPHERRGTDVEQLRPGKPPWRSAGPWATCSLSGMHGWPTSMRLPVTAGSSGNVLCRQQLMADQQQKHPAEGRSPALQPAGVQLQPQQLTREALPGPSADSGRPCMLITRLALQLFT